MMQLSVKNKHLFALIAEGIIIIIIIYVYMIEDRFSFILFYDTINAADYFLASIRGAVK